MRMLLAFFACASLAPIVRAQDKAPEIVVGAGDIADCDPATSAHAATGRVVKAILDSFPTAHAFAIGDVTYPGSQPGNWACYNATWGQFKARTWFAMGNHDLYGDTTGKRFYDQTDGVAADSGPAGARNHGWHFEKLPNGALLIFVNSEYQTGSATTTPDRLRAGSVRQATWLKAVVAANPGKCQLLFMHRTLFSSGTGGISGYLQPLYQAAYDAHVDVIQGAHVHKYESMKRINPAGQVDSLGFRQFVTGTGGKLESWPWLATPQPYSRIRLEGPGVTRHDIYPDSVISRYIDTLGVVRDSVRTECR